jgi:hypothetical protein
MRKRIEQINDGVWKGHSRILQDVTHLIGGIGLGMLVSATSTGRGRPLGISLVLLSTALHVYAATVKPRRRHPVTRLKEIAGAARSRPPRRLPKARPRWVGGRLASLARSALQG